MRFIKNGPDFPDRLIQQHEDGKVVFFCGSGISFSAGLKGFDWLVNELLKKCGIVKNKQISKLMKNKSYDAALQYLEDNYSSNNPRIDIRMFLFDILSPKKVRGAFDTHEALLKLSTDRNGKVRLVSTNFDRIFSLIAPNIANHFTAPLLPIPKKSRWDGIVHLHGLLPDSASDETYLNNLVLTSGDFGLAYLVERWASRFVSELFRSYTVCFVGYSIDDPVMRYMMHAIAADSLRGENPHTAYALVGYNNKHNKSEPTQWDMKSIEPLFYIDTNQHEALHKSLHAWSDNYAKGTSGKIQIIENYAKNAPSKPFVEDYAVDMVLWALSDVKASEYFSNMDPAPSLDWLGPLDDDRFTFDDLIRFGIAPYDYHTSTQNLPNGKITFSLLNRFTPYHLAPPMTPSVNQAYYGSWDDIMHNLAKWLSNHISDPELLLWIVSQGDFLHDGIRRHIQPKLSSIHDPDLKNLWQLVLMNKLKPRDSFHGLFHWVESFKENGLTPALRIQLYDLLTPCISIQRAFRRPDEIDVSDNHKNTDGLVSSSVKLASDHVRQTLMKLNDDSRWSEALPELLVDATTLLRNTMSLFDALGKAHDKLDLSYGWLPSISEHMQNNHIEDCSYLIELARDSWRATLKVDSKRAKNVVHEWWSIPYPVFKRLVFFASASSNIFSNSQILSWLLSNNRYWLWSPCTKRESMRLLHKIAGQLSPKQTSRLVKAILQGPPRRMYRDDLKDSEFVQSQKHSVWLRLKLLEQAGATLDLESKQALSDLASELHYEDRKVEDKDEFPVWVGDGSELREALPPVPTMLDDIVKWLEEHPATSSWEKEDTWIQRCIELPSETASALSVLAKRNFFPEQRWQQAFNAWDKRELLESSWRTLSETLGNCGRIIVNIADSSLCWWLYKQADTFNDNENVFFDLIDLLISKQYDERYDNNDIVFDAINHPIGIATLALLTYWYRCIPSKHTEIVHPFRSLLTKICSQDDKHHRSGIVVLTGHIINFYITDEHWTRQNLLPKFDWSKSEENALAAWLGFLRSLRVYPPLMSEIRTCFLEAVNHYNQLQSYADGYADLLTFCAFEGIENISEEEFQIAISNLPSGGLKSLTKALLRRLENAPGDHKEYFTKFIQPFLHTYWPKFNFTPTPDISLNLSLICVASGDGFPAAVTMLSPWIRPIKYPHDLFKKLYSNGLCKKYPKSSLTLLSSVVDQTTYTEGGFLNQCLDDISKMDGGLTSDPKYIAIRNFL